MNTVLRVIVTENIFFKYWHRWRNWNTRITLERDPIWFTELKRKLLIFLTGIYSGAWVSDEQRCAKVNFFHCSKFQILKWLKIPRRLWSRMSWYVCAISISISRSDWFVNCYLLAYARSTFIFPSFHLLSSQWAVVGEFLLFSIHFIQFLFSSSTTPPPPRRPAAPVKKRIYSVSNAETIRRCVMKSVREMLNSEEDVHLSIDIGFHRGDYANIS